MGASIAVGRAVVEEQRAVASWSFCRRSDFRRQLSCELKSLFGLRLRLSLSRLLSPLTRQVSCCRRQLAVSGLQ